MYNWEAFMEQQEAVIKSNWAVAYEWLAAFEKE